MRDVCPVCNCTYLGIDIRDSADGQRVVYIHELTKDYNPIRWCWGELYLQKDIDHPSGFISHWFTSQQPEQIEELERWVKNA